jgi:hypothetical protein
LKGGEEGRGAFSTYSLSLTGVNRICDTPWLGVDSPGGDGILVSLRRAMWINLNLQLSRDILIYIYFSVDRLESTFSKDILFAYNSSLNQNAYPP